MRSWGLSRLGNWCTFLSASAYFAMSFGVCALFGGVALELSLSSLEMGLLLSAPLLIGTLFASVLLLCKGSRPVGDVLQTARFGVPDARRVCFLYALTFGGLAVLTGYVTIFFHDRHGLSFLPAAATAALIAGACFVLGPVGSYLAGRFGEIQLLLIVFIGSGVLLLDLAASPPLAWTTILPVLVMALLALGNGVIAQYLPQRLSSEVRRAGLAGGFGGCLLLITFGSIKFLTGGYSLALLLLAFVAFSGTAALINLLTCDFGAKPQAGDNLQHAE